jgi:hypothetical protein
MVAKTRSDERPVAGLRHRPLAKNLSLGVEYLRTTYASSDALTVGRVIGSATMAPRH